jgi:ABC-2 type transport system permease protein
MIVWIVLTIVLMSVAGMFLPIDPAAMQHSMGPLQQQPPDESIAQVAETLALIKDQNWSYIIPVFIFYFLGGYFIYSSLFAAVGSAMGDDMGEGQSLSFVAMLPIIVSIIMISPVIENPTSSLATWLSIIPLFSPVIMPARIAFEPPLWEVLLSMAILLASAVFFVWFAGRIYRVGILMYGKKASLKELGKWMFYRD